MVDSPLPHFLESGRFEGVHGGAHVGTMCIDVDAHTMSSLHSRSGEQAGPAPVLLTTILKLAERGDGHEIFMCPCRTHLVLRDHPDMFLAEDEHTQLIQFECCSAKAPSDL